MELKFSSSLFQVRLSRLSVELLGRAVDRVTGLVQRSSNEDGAAESCDSGTVARGDRDKENMVYFTDDLRTEDFKYIMDESSKFMVVVC